ncbi:PQQ-binding-like beta-propeller repeat protein [Streptomyces sp. NPDC056194]|uniref:outer membrane protein assembly factor BamB family protein n=1 Tax=unclassified Streptomyces TaxID=2593676 RepID=UPI0035D84E5E
MPRIPRGAADASAGRAVVRDRQGTLIALDLETGAVLWRQGRDLRPCALVAGTVVALRVGSLVRVELLDTDEGTERWTSPPVDLPVWARPALHDSPEFGVDTDGDQDPVVIRWTARALYRGGAPPGPDVAGSQPRTAHGALRIGVASPSMEPQAWTATEAESEAETKVPHPPLAADVLEYGQVGDLRMELTVGPGSGGEDAVVLRAVDTRTASAVWEVVLDETAESRPRKLRP